MGWSCRKDAMDSFNKIQKALCLGPTQNVYCLNGRDVLIENDCQEYDDGSIKGQLYWLNGTLATFFMDFHIGPDGELVQYPEHWQFALEGKPIKGLTKPKE